MCMDNMFSCYPVEASCFTSLKVLSALLCKVYVHQVTIITRPFLVVPRRRLSTLDTRAFSALQIWNSPQNSLKDPDLGRDNFVRLHRTETFSVLEMFRDDTLYKLTYFLTIIIKETVTSETVLKIWIQLLVTLSIVWHIFRLKNGSISIRNIVAITLINDWKGVCLLLEEWPISHYALHFSIVLSSSTW